ncbi:protein claret segregational isoform X2 [Copidosoma floridanum]|uniref:protein claret segregational isoform X2 n=1 Tax=Copidosoma floridanum TaxID=29053 RepID=UPI0006C98A6D|nr:protein claret segregational isoform X2 [Copidosoma floridanum]
MQSRLPKLNFQFKVPARTMTGNSTTTSSASNGMEATSSTTSVNSSAATKNMSTTSVTTKAADENKAPVTRSKVTTTKTTTTTLSRTLGAPTTRGAQKRPGLANNTVVDPKRPNLRTTMKPTARPIRPATSTVGPLAKTVPSATPASAKPSGSKPNKWDFKGRLEWTSNELTALKQKHRDVTMQYNSIQDEIVSLRKSESTNRSKAEKLEKSAGELRKQVDVLKAKVDELQKENDVLTKDLNKTKDEYEKTFSKLGEYETDIKVKSVLITDQQKELTEWKEKFESKVKENEELDGLVQTLDRERRYLHNTIQEMKGNIRVFCRVRPKIPKEASKSLCNINYLDECTLEVGRGEGDTSKMKTQRQEFTFDKVFPPNTCQADIFEELSMLVQSALEGYNVCVFAYGQTGSGKTYTMEGLPGTEQEGMIPRTVKHIFREMKHFELLGWEYKIEASFLEIYNEQIVDLLDNSRKTHEIRMADNKGHDLYVSNLLIQEINSPEELNQCLLIAQQNRAMAATQSNERSSRSHSVARIRLIGTHKSKQEVSIGNLNLVDLAGSERLKNEEAARVAETKNINKSLANLGHVILALLQKQDHIPYRNSKLTHLLMPSLGGNSKTLMLLNISPLDDSYNETVNSLRFGSNVNSCKTGTVKKVKTVL